MALLSCASCVNWMRSVECDIFVDKIKITHDNATLNKEQVTRTLLVETSNTWGVGSPSHVQVIPWFPFHCQADQNDVACKSTCAKDFHRLATQCFIIAGGFGRCIQSFLPGKAVRSSPQYLFQSHSFVAEPAPLRFTCPAPCSRRPDS